MTSIKFWMISKAKKETLIILTIRRIILLLSTNKFSLNMIMKVLEQIMKQFKKIKLFKILMKKINKIKKIIQFNQ